MHELTINLHMHTTYSDGSGTHADLGRAALNTGVDVLLVTDHNILVQGMNAYYRDGKKRVLVLSGEEIHDQDRNPQKNHLLVFGADRELAPLADNPQSLHPVDPAMPAFGETDISWVDWDISGFTGIELWNGFSELKSVAKGKADAVAYAYFPEFIPHGPLLETLHRWDELTAKGQRVVAVGGSDAHAQHKSLGPLHKIIFPYEYHFSTINTHTLTPTPLTGDLIRDRKMVFDALAAGHCFIGYDLPAPTRGFHFSAQSKGSTAIMGDEITPAGAVTLQAKLPSAAEIRLVRNGRLVKTAHGETLVQITDEPGVYRIEAYKHYLGKLRGWIFSNPIYIK
ncbi:MAG: CehA/McbA family metallohydrolase [Chloroflexi bacterium]|nr:CehA/McbA family metallohydrolase [Chloroflexota bacterium]